MEIEDKGISRIGIVPVRKDCSDRSEMVTQLLFGEHYTITEISNDGKWCRIKVHFDGYEGWIDVKQHQYISKAYFDQINNSDYKISLDLSSTILYKKHPITIVMGSILPISTNELFKMEEQLAFNGESKSLSQKRGFDFIKQTALSYLNAPYLWGGRTPFGIDCSGFTQIVYRINGCYLERDSSEQYKQGEVIQDVDNTKPGDLAFFQNDKGDIVHVGIILEGRKIIHASGKVRVDIIDDEGIKDSKNNIYTHYLAGFQRVIRE